jgi:hypothetical protein
VRHRRPRLRSARLDADARPDRPRSPPLGAQATTPATAEPPRPARAHRPPPAAAPGRDRPVHRTCPRRPRPAGRPTGSRARLNRRLTVPTTQETHRTVEPAPTRATSADRSHPHATLTPTRDQNPDDDRDDHRRESSGLVSRHVEGRFLDKVGPYFLFGRGAQSSRMSAQFFAPRSHPCSDRGWKEHRSGAKTSVRKGAGPPSRGGGSQLSS